jgi:rhamnosyltransferase
MTSNVAIIMRAFNEMPHVLRTLEALKQQTFSNFDLLATDSGSSDGTLKALKNSELDIQLTQIKSSDYVPGRVLNRAIENTSHEIILLLNADAVPLSDDALEQLLKPLQKNEADAVFAKQTARSDARFVVAYDYERAYSSTKMAPDFFSAVACAFKRALWHEHRFPEEGYAEDLAWARRCMADGARLQFVPEAVVEHSHNYALRALYRKRHRQAVTFNEKPRLIRQLYLCTREVARDLVHAAHARKLQTSFYNLSYRITIHAATYAGLTTGWRRFSPPKRVGPNR